jgi:hypothetical protein
MEQSFPDYFMTPFHTENLTGSSPQILPKHGDAVTVVNGLRLIP